jgi:transcriptional regulator with XRE-family HTH domain
MSRRENPVRLLGDRVRAEAKRQGLTSMQLARELKVTPRTLSNWLRGSNGCTVEKVESLARLLGVGTLDIAKGMPSDYDSLECSEITFVERVRLVGLSKVALNLLNESSKFLSYLPHVSPLTWPREGFVQPFRHDGNKTNYYAEIQIIPEAIASGRRTEFILSFILAKARFDYGRVTLHKGQVLATPTFPSSILPNRAILDSGGRARVWTWFGMEPCDFLIRSHHRFEIEVVDTGCSDPPAVDDTGAVCFRAAPHHIVATHR